MMILEGSLMNVITAEIYSGRLGIEDELIEFVEQTGTASPLTLENIEKFPPPFILPGLVDGHIHIESSMLTPTRFGQIAVSHGTTSVISDPHEIANVIGIPGLRFMIEDGRNSPINVYYTAPSCVPATDFETSGGSVNSNAIERLLKIEDIVALGEMMNYPGVVNGDKEILAKIDEAKKAGKPIDGHAPGLTGPDLCKYVKAGITTDHECSTMDEAVEKSRLGMKIQVRQGSAARNLPDLLGIYGTHGVMTVSDDRGPCEMLEGHMDSHLKLLLKNGIPFTDAIRSMTINPCEHYGIGSGALVPGRLADIVVLDDLLEFKVNSVYVRGKRMFADCTLPPVEPRKLDYTPKAPSFSLEDLMIKSEIEGARYKVRVMEVADGRITTGKGEGILETRDGHLIPNIDEDILPLVVIDRYEGKRIGKGFVRGFGIRNGALCSSIAHDSHNIICVGSDYKQMERVVKRVSRTGGIGAVSGIMLAFLPLPEAGLMSTEHVNDVAEDLTWVKDIVKLSGCSLESPVITLSFLSLLVIPELKLSDRGLFDSGSFNFVDVIMEKVE